MMRRKKLKFKLPTFSALARTAKAGISCQLKMENHVTFETGKLLKEAGFPQPELERGEFFYPSGIFAPTATDILRELGKDYALSFMDGEWYVECSADGFFSRLQSIWRHINPAEAAALAFFATKKTRYETNK